MVEVTLLQTFASDLTTHLGEHSFDTAPRVGEFIYLYNGNKELVYRVLMVVHNPGPKAATEAYVLEISKQEFREALQAAIQA